MRQLKTALFYAGWVLLTLIMGAVCLPALFSTRAVWVVADIWCDITLWWLRVTCGISRDVAPLLSPEIQLYAANHESTLDTLILWRALCHPAFVLKRELCWIPVFGWYLWRTKPIAIHRTSKRAMETLIAGASTRLSEGRNIIIFPQGTRSAPETNTPFKRGIAVLSEALQLRVQPIALATHPFWPKTEVLKRAGVACARAAMPLHACTSDEVSLWLAELSKRICDARAQAVESLAPRSMQRAISQV